MKLLKRILGGPVTFLVMIALIGGFSITSHAQQFQDPFYTDRIGRIRDLSNRASHVVVGVVKNLGPSPVEWSGRYLVTQSVIYDLHLVLKGSISTKSIRVHHAIVQGSRLVRTDVPGLSPQLFRPGNRLILFLQAETGPSAQVMSFQDIDEQVGTIPFSEQNLIAIRAIMGIP